MATSYPTTLDTFVNPQPTDQVSVVSHAGQHQNANDSIAALEAKVGANSSAVTTSHDYKLSGVATGDKAVSKTGTETLTNKTLTSPAIANPTTTGTDAGTATLTNKTITDTTNNVAANSLKSATTVVSVAAATAPVNGQILTATSGTTATWQNPTGVIDYSVLAYNSTTASVASNAYAVLQFDSERFDTDTMHDNVTNNSRITFTHAGKYGITASIASSAVPWGGIDLKVRLNGTTDIAFGGGTTGTSAIPGVSSLTGIYSFIAGDYIELLAGAASGGTAAAGFSFGAWKIA